MEKSIVSLDSKPSAILVTRRYAWEIQLQWGYRNAIRSEIETTWSIPNIEWLLVGNTMTPQSRVTGELADGARIALPKLAKHIAAPSRLT